MLLEHNHNPKYVKIKLRKPIYNNNNKNKKKCLTYLFHFQIKRSGNLEKIYENKNY